MHKSMYSTDKYYRGRKSAAFNVSKLQAVLCIMASVAVSTGLILMGVKTFI